MADEAVIKVIPSEETEVVLQISNATGSVLVEESRSLSAGLNILRYDFSGYRKGMYFIAIRTGDEVEIRRVVKR